MKPSLKRWNSDELNAGWAGDNDAAEFAEQMKYKGNTYATKNPLQADVIKELIKCAEDAMFIDFVPKEIKYLSQKKWELIIPKWQV